MPSLTGVVSLDGSKVSGKLFQKNYNERDNLETKQEFTDNLFYFQCSFNHKIQNQGIINFNEEVCIGFIGEIFEKSGFIKDPFNHIKSAYFNR